MYLSSTLCLPLFSVLGVTFKLIKLYRNGWVCEWAYQAHAQGNEGSEGPEARASVLSHYEHFLLECHCWVPDVFDPDLK